MSNPHGTPIWYELLTADPTASKAFYDDVIGWAISDRSDQPGMDYRMIAVSPGDFVGGMMPLTSEMQAGGAKPGWLFYIGVDDVDATAERLKAAGGTIHMAPFDIPGAGRAAMVADRQGVPFYIMRGSSPESSTAWGRMAMGKCNWNELNTSDQADAQAFYADLFGWQYPDKMPMGAMGDYVFVEAAGETIGATMTAPEGSPPPAWQFYFRAPDIEAAAARVSAGGGTVHYGPAEVPGGDRIIVASDPQGVMFGVVGPGDATDD
ncbi:VOC family protein [Sphingomonas sp.]|uniref:VOC family protein n=1 Tax=Sphingomonas sp. TaxID=28214 RepID=UPI002DD627E6|nr:VOC family protein [Sphingomonas sp.]